MIPRKELERLLKESSRKRRRSDFSRFQPFQKGPWHDYFLLVSIAKRYPSIKGKLQEFFAGKEVIILVHPGWSSYTKVVGAKFPNTERYGDYDTYLRNLRTLVKEKSDAAIFIYLMPYDSLNKLFQLFNPSGFYLVVPTEEANPTTVEISISLSDIAVFLKSLGVKKVKIGGEFMWFRRSLLHLFTGKNPLIFKVFERLERDLAKKFKQWKLEHDTITDKDVEDFIQQNKITIPEDIMAQLSTQDGCVAVVIKEFQKKLTVERMRRCCFPLKNPSEANL